MFCRSLGPLAVLALAACQNGTHVASARHCEHATGSLLCTNGDDMPVGDSTASPSITTPFNGQNGGK